MADDARLGELLEELGPAVGTPHSRAMGKGPFEPRPRGRSETGRALSCFVHDRRIVIVHAFRQKTRTKPGHDLAIARRRAKRSNVAELEHRSVNHDHEAILAHARQRRGFQQAHDALEAEYQVANERIAARAYAGLAQDAVAQRMGTTKSAISRLERSGKHAPSIGTLQRYAEAVGCELKIELVPRAGQAWNRSDSRQPT